MPDAGSVRSTRRGECLLRKRQIARFTQPIELNVPEAAPACKGRVRAVNGVEPARIESGHIGKTSYSDGVFPSRKQMTIFDSGEEHASSCGTGSMHMTLRFNHFALLRPPRLVDTVIYSPSQRTIGMNCEGNSSGLILSAAEDGTTAARV